MIRKNGLIVGFDLHGAVICQEVIPQSGNQDGEEEIFRSSFDSIFLISLEWGASGMDPTN
jgi:hypothetical protein